MQGYVIKRNNFASNVQSSLSSY